MGVAEHMGERGQCPTCGPTGTERHPHRASVTRCSNCKEWLRFGDEPPTGRDHTADVAAAIMVGVVDDHAVVATGLGEWCCKCSPGDWRPSAHRGPHVVAAILASEPIAQALAAVEAVARVEALFEEWEGWAKTRSTPRIDAFRDAAQYGRAALRPEGDDQ